MKKYVILFVCLLNSTFSSLWGGDDIRDSVHRLNWNDLEVVWVEDDRFPTFTVTFYFADGALADEAGELGSSNAMFRMLTSGTRRYGQKDISDYLEFYGSAVSTNVSHEYSTVSVSGLVKDSIPLLKQVCHLFSDASFPEDELDKEKKRAVDGLMSLVNNHSSLATTAFREISLEGTPYAYPFSGKLVDIKKINRNMLVKRHQYFNEKVKKRLYLTGPEKILDIKSVLLEECRWKNKEANFVRTQPHQKEKFERRVVLVTVPSANQAQIRIGRFLNKEHISRPEVLSMGSSFLGGGFTSKLMRAVRTTEGLTYSIGAFAAGQKEYGRAGISTFTKDVTTKALIELVDKNLVEVKQNQFSDEDFERARNFLIGSYPFNFELSEEFMAQIITLDHEGRPLETLYELPSMIEKLRRNEVVDVIGQIFDPSQLTYVVLGELKLAKELEKLGQKVEIRSYKEFL
jgi:zinc protease